MKYFLKILALVTLPLVYVYIDNNYFSIPTWLIVLSVLALIVEIRLDVQITKDNSKTL